MSNTVLNEETMDLLKSIAESLDKVGVMADWLGYVGDGKSGGAIESGAKLQEAAIREGLGEVAEAVREGFAAIVEVMNKGWIIK
jgi:hypothetical protein